MIGLARNTLLVVIACLVMVGALPIANAQTAQEPPKSSTANRDELRDKLFAALRQARNEAEAQRLENEIWPLWSQGPDQQANQQISEIFAARRSYDLDKALRIATELTERVLELEPRHFGSLAAGKAVILIRQGRMALAQDTLRKAVAIHPFLRERHLLIKPKGQPI